MKTFSNPRLMLNLRFLQIGICDANLIKAQRQSPLFNVIGKLGKLSLVKIVKVSHG